MPFVCRLFVPFVSFASRFVPFVPFTSFVPFLPFILFLLMCNSCRIFVPSDKNVYFSLIVGPPTFSRCSSLLAN